MRYVLAVASIVAAETVESLVFGAWLGRPPATFVELIAAVILSSRFLGAGPGCLTAALASLDLAYDLYLNESFATERFFGTIGAYLLILLVMPRSYRGPTRYLRSLWGAAVHLCSPTAAVGVTGRSRLPTESGGRTLPEFVRWPRRR